MLPGPGLDVVAEVIPVDEFISEEWYPGFTPAYGHSPWVTEPVDTFKAEDQERFWFLDFHFPRGLSPMGMVFLEDGYSWATQLAARNLPLPRGNGIVQRLAGTHVYASVVPVDSEWEAGLRADRFGRNLPRFLDSFPELWASRVWELETSLAHFEQYDFTDRSLDELGGYLRDARTFHRRAWEIHFEVMYPLLANYIGFRGVCGQLGIDPGQISKFLQGYDTKILECDRELWTLTVAASLAASVRDKRSLGFSDVRATEEPHPRTVRFFATILPKIIGHMSERWFKHAPALVAYANEEINLAEIYTEIGSPAGGKWQQFTPEGTF